MLYGNAGSQKSTGYRPFGLEKRMRPVVGAAYLPVFKGVEMRLRGCPLVYEPAGILCSK